MTGARHDPLDEGHCCDRYGVALPLLSVDAILQVQSEPLARYHRNNRHNRIAVRLMGAMWIVRLHPTLFPLHRYGFNTCPSTDLDWFSEAPRTTYYFTKQGCVPATSILMDASGRRPKFILLARVNPGFSRSSDVG